MLAAHVIFGAYGFWLTNDPRGSWSTFVGSWELFRHGPATKTTETSSLARRPHDRAERLAAKTALKRPAVQFTGIQARAVARGFARYAERSGLRMFACAVLPDHIHLVMAPARIAIPQVVIQLKGEATLQLVEEGIHPFAGLRDKHGRLPKCFARGQWKVYLDDAVDVRRAIRYVEDNPLKEGKPRQRWGFVTGFGG
ncbi:MAG: transposase [Pirellulales bacterium]|nr:transposase [Pirellulales bacterium]